MFGYVNISPGDISDDDKKIYGAYYCGLCKAIGRKSQIFRLGLNNDLTFLAILLSAISEEEPVVANNKKCIAHAIKKHDEIEFNAILDYVSDMNILLVYLKVCDDVDDDKTLISKIKKIFLNRYARKIGRKYNELYTDIKSNLKRLSRLEKDRSESIDETADCFACILRDIFTYNIKSDNEIKEILAWLGYNLGKWIYTIDAYEDMEDDLKHNKYNPFYNAYKKDAFKKSVFDMLNYTLNNIVNAYDLLRIYRNDTLIKNIIYSGLAIKQDSTFKEVEEKDGSL